MKFTLTAVAAATLALGLPLAHAEIKLSDNVSLSGFGTLAAAQSDDSNSDFVGTPFQPNGAGHTRSVAFGPDSKLGVQLNAVANSQLSAVLQVITQHQYDNTWKPLVEWANVKYQVTPEISVRAGRIALPVFLASDSRFVGYASPLVRQPVEVYSTMPITSNDGIDASWRTRIGDANNLLQVYYGTSKVNVSAKDTAKSKATFGVRDSVEIGSLTLQASLTSYKLDLSIASLAPLLNGIAQFTAAPAPIGTEAAALLDKYRLTDQKLSTFALGFNYDPGDWFVTAELLRFRGAGFLTDKSAWYAGGGYRFGSFTPYATYATVKSTIDNEPGISSPSAAGLNAGINATLKAFSASQDSTTVGLRWDAMKNTAVKVQYDRITLRDGTSGRVRSISGLAPSENINVLSLALDFVF